MTNLKPELQKVITEKAQSAHEYYARTNELLGVIGFSLAVGSAGTENAPFFAFSSSIFLLFAWGFQTVGYRRKLKLLRDIRHESVSLKYVGRQAIPALVGWLALALVATGAVDKFGWRFGANHSVVARTADAVSTVSDAK